MQAPIRLHQPRRGHTSRRAILRDLEKCARAHHSKIEKGGLGRWVVSRGGVWVSEWGRVAGVLRWSVRGEWECQCTDEKSYRVPTREGGAGERRAGGGQQ